MDTSVKKKEKILEGKTKVLWNTNVNSDLIIIKNKDDITKNDDASQTKILESKAKYATDTTCSIFQFLKDAGIPVAYEARLSDTEFIAPYCNMIPLEVVGRRYAVGSYLKRFPNLQSSEGELPHRFDIWEFELFLKTSNGRILDCYGEHIGNTPVDILATDRLRLVDDPFILNPYGSLWELYHPKIPVCKDDANLKIAISRPFVLPAGVSVWGLRDILLQISALLENAFSNFDIKLIDFKIEFGVDNKGRLLVADVIDNDSWRIKDNDWNDLSKELFRQNFDLDFIQSQYALVASLVQGFNTLK